MTGTEMPERSGRVETPESAEPPKPDRRPWIAAAVLLVVAAVAGVWLGSRQRVDDAPADDPAEVAEMPTVPDEVILAPARLFFPAADGRLRTEIRELPVGDARARTTSLVQALLDGPASDAAVRLLAPLPAGTELAEVYLLDTTAVVDLRPPAVADAGGDGGADGNDAAADGDDGDDDADDPAPGAPIRRRAPQPSFGSQHELLALYSLVDTIVLGVDGVDRVQVLWDGRQPETFGGHVDTRRPLNADPAMVADL